jgi:hypothetical protein
MQTNATGACCLLYQQHDIVGMSQLSRLLKSCKWARIAACTQKQTHRSCTEVEECMQNYHMD